MPRIERKLEAEAAALHERAVSEGAQIRKHLAAVATALARAVGKYEAEVDRLGQVYGTALQHATEHAASLERQLALAHAHAERLEAQIRMVLEERFYRPITGAPRPAAPATPVIHPDVLGEATPDDADAVQKELANHQVLTDAYWEKYGEAAEEAGQPAPAAGEGHDA